MSNCNLYIYIVMSLSRDIHHHHHHHHHRNSIEQSKHPVISQTSSDTFNHPPASSGGSHAGEQKPCGSKSQEYLLLRSLSLSRSFSFWLSALFLPPSPPRIAPPRVPTPGPRSTSPRIAPPPAPRKVSLDLWPSLLRRDLRLRPPERDRERLLSSPWWW